jgi:hypothetical protein
MSAFDRRAGRVSTHSLGRASSDLRSKRLKGGKWHTEGGLKGLQGCSEKDLKGDVLGESGTTIIHMILLPKVQRRKDDAWRRCKTHDMSINVRCKREIGLCNNASAGCAAMLPTLH